MRPRKCHRGASRSGASPSSLTTPAAAPCWPPGASSCRSPVDRQSGAGRGWGPPACIHSGASIRTPAGSHTRLSALGICADCDSCAAPPGHDWVSLQAQHAAELQEHGAKDKHVDLQHVRKVQKHERVLVLPADDVDAGRCDLHQASLLSVTSKQAPVLQERNQTGQTPCLGNAPAPCEIVLDREHVQTVCRIDDIIPRTDAELDNLLVDFISALYAGFLCCIVLRT